MEPLVLITGGGTGIGQALAWKFAEKEHGTILITGRRREMLQATAAVAPDRIRFLVSDISSESDRQLLTDHISSEYALRYIIHNAAVIEPVRSLLQVNLDQWREHQAINVEGPLFLTQSLLSLFSGDGRIMHISSGAAHFAYAGWGAYCTSKAALHMIYQVLRVELAGQGIAIGSVRPGIVDTPMQQLIRAKDETDFPQRQRFVDYERKRQLENPERVAEFIYQVLTNTSAEEYSEKEWDFRSDAGRWFEQQ